MARVPPRSGAGCGPAKAVYVPTAADEALGRQLLAQWRRFAQTGEPGWQAVDWGGVPDYFHGVIEAETTRSVMGYKTDACARLNASGVGQKWWWVN